MQKRLVAKAGVALVVVATIAGCAEAETIPRKAARLTIDGNSHSTRPPTCSQDQSYRTIDGFTGSAWQGGVGDAHVDLAKNAYTITSSAYGINSNNPNRVVMEDFKITAEC